MVADRVEYSSGILVFVMTYTKKYELKIDVKADLAGILAIFAMMVHHRLLPDPIQCGHSISCSRVGKARFSFAHLFCFVS